MKKNLLKLLFLGVAALSTSLYAPPKKANPEKENPEKENPGEKLDAEVAKSVPAVRNVRGDYEGGTSPTGASPEDLCSSGSEDEEEKNTKLKIKIVKILEQVSIEKLATPSPSKVVPETIANKLTIKNIVNGFIGSGTYSGFNDSKLVEDLLRARTFMISADCFKRVSLTNKDVNLLQLIQLINNCE